LLRRTILQDDFDEGACAYEIGRNAPDPIALGLRASARRVLQLKLFDEKWERHVQKRACPAEKRASSDILWTGNVTETAPG
jgi:hypothetical protein